MKTQYKEDYCQDQNSNEIQNKPLEIIEQPTPKPIEPVKIESIKEELN